MEPIDFDIRLAPEIAVEYLDRGIVDGSFSGERIDCHIPYKNGDTVCIVVVYEKFYYRAGNRLTLTVTLDNFRGVTHVHSIGGGGGNDAWFSFDWGASRAFTDAAYDILGEYSVE